MTGGLNLNEKPCDHPLFQLFAIAVFDRRKNAYVHTATGDGRGMAKRQVSFYGMGESAAALEAAYGEPSHHSQANE